MSEDWYLVDSERSVGPFDLSELTRRLRKSANWTNTLIWKADFPDWKKAGDVSELKLRLATPPPVPSSRCSDQMPSWRVRWWWYVVALAFFGSIGSSHGFDAMGWESDQRKKLRKLKTANEGAAVPQSGIGETIRRLWWGLYPLPTAFWGFYCLGFLVALIVFGAAAALLSGAFPSVRPVFLIGGTIIIWGYWAIASVGVWRSANDSKRYIAFWRYAAKFSVGASFLAFVLKFASGGGQALIGRFMGSWNY
jgi:hypothetical protein